MEEHLIRMSSLYDDEDFATDGLKAVCCTDMDETRCYCSAESYSELRRRLSDVPLHAVHHIDTGDFHYLSALFLERIREDFELLLFDNHPDTQALAFEAPGMVSCGSWRARSQEESHFLKASRVIGNGGDNTGFLERFEDAPGMAGLPVYISIDLDVLSPCEFTADWDQGTMGFDELMQLVRKWTEGRRILGADICGGLTLAQAASAGVLPSACPFAGASPSETARRNREVRSRLASFLTSLA